MDVELFSSIHTDDAYLEAFRRDLTVNDVLQPLRGVTMNLYLEK